MKAKKFILAALTVGLGLTAAGCSSGAAKNANYQVPETFDTETKMTINFYHTMGDSLQKTLKTAITAFETAYPNVSIDPTQVGGYDDVRNQIVNEIPNEQQPHLAYCYPDHVALYNKSRAVIQLDSLIENETYGFTQEELADFVPGYYAEGKQFGDEFTYTLPFSKSTEVLYYNKTEFDKNGWAVPKTWEEMATLCATIKAKYPESIPLGIDSESNLFITLTEQIGSGYTAAKGNHFLFNNAENKAFVSKFKEWFDAGYFTTQTILNAYTSSLFTSTEANRSFMSIGSTGGASHQYSSAFECGIAQTPTWGNVEQKVISQGPSLCFFQKSNPQEVLATWIFVKDFLLTPTFQAAFSMTSGYNPVLRSCTEIEGYKAFLDGAVGTSADGVKALAAKISAEMADYYYTSPAFVGSSKAREQVGDLFVAVVSGTKTLDKAFEDALLECED